MELTHDESTFLRTVAARAASDPAIQAAAEAGELDSVLPNEAERLMRECLAQQDRKIRMMRVPGSVESSSEYRTVTRAIWMRVNVEAYA